MLVRGHVSEARAACLTFQREGGSPQTSVCQGEPGSQDSDVRTPQGGEPPPGLAASYLYGFPQAPGRFKDLS